MNKISKRDNKIKERSYGIVVVRIVNNEPLFLMLRSYSLWEPPKGKSEVGEDGLTTAIRETQEEASLKPEDLKFNWGKEAYETEPYKKNKKTATFFLAETNVENIILPYNEEIGKAEHDEYKWLSYEQAKKLANDRNKKVLDWAYNKIKGK